MQWYNLMMLLAWCDTDASASVIKGPKSHVALHFKLSWPQECNVAIFGAIASCDANASAAPLFWISSLNKYSGAIDDAIGITWCWC